MVGADEDRKIKIAVLIGAPLTRQNFERIGIPYLSPHFHVMIYDCMPWLGRPYCHVDNDVLRECLVVSISDESELAEKISHWGPDYAIDFIDFGIYTLSLVRVLDTYGVKLVVQKTGSLPRLGITVRIRYCLLSIWFKLIKSKSSVDASPALISIPSSSKRSFFPGIVEFFFAESSQD